MINAVFRYSAYHMLNLAHMKYTYNGSCLHKLLLNRNTVSMLGLFVERRHFPFLFSNFDVTFFSLLYFFLFLLSTLL